ncbi:hypothetical protein [Lacticaseibacillus manihotivorans]|uniref:hypothetical protein n=1 Tax=Lacticaseibacillus manihotivorans TaxID=88233 RepID=UPI0006D17D9D|nr:hypothetical protein [Lacticaseibacillus manihotivorans]
MQKLLSWSKSNAGLIVFGDLILTLIMLGSLNLLARQWRCASGCYLSSSMGYGRFGSAISCAKPLAWWYSLIMPVLFGLMVYLRFAKYNYWFLPIYWLLTMLSWIKKD